MALFQLGAGVAFGRAAWVLGRTPGRRNAD
jgi:hypothetical protein